MTGTMMTSVDSKTLTIELQGTDGDGGAYANTLVYDRR